MSKSLVIPIPNGVIEESIRANLGLEEPISLWWTVYDEKGMSVVFVVEVDDSDADKLAKDGMEELDYYSFRDEGLVQ